MANDGAIIAPPKNDVACPSSPEYSPCSPEWVPTAGYFPAPYVCLSCRGMTGAYYQEDESESCSRCSVPVQGVVSPPKDDGRGREELDEDEDEALREEAFEEAWAAHVNEESSKGKLCQGCGEPDGFGHALCHCDPDKIPPKYFDPDTGELTALGVIANTIAN
jgi:hypothetical protein